jgi:hypothetical protein
MIFDRGRILVSSGRKMHFEAGDATKNISGSLTVAGRDAARVVLRTKANWSFAGAAFFPEALICIFHRLIS